MQKDIKRIATMQRLQVKGLEIFYKKGYSQTRVADILEELSLSKGAFYHHFQSKEDFFISIIQNLLFRKVYSLLIEPVEGKERPLETIANCLDEALATAEHNTMDYGFVLGNFLTEFKEGDNKISGYLLDILKVWEVTLVTALQKGKTDGYVSRHIDSAAVANFVIASFMGTRSMMVAGNARMLRYQYMQQLKQYFATLTERTSV